VGAVNFTFRHSV